ncbi:alkaline phosphatase family protein [Endozoicomonas sp. SM1973]|uniref:Alkaline phosphatase family protein n=1 Tax=Spartinivicinus marinus TaxID=2994442 RepID=A0A853HVJ0_9GAMM|nr:alkaline phosphatase family protein [Spartinivicinus marinus]MCX4026593.1 alkaline phosphatase family protein [Spartinivicinus marinus]NYZ64429.1 alkaline phosphatase family protein [Spartinivicinus marinus]
MDKKIKIRSCWLMTLLLFIATSLGASEKVLLVGIDGVQYERILALNTPAFDRLNLIKAYAGGVQWQKTQQRTVSGPGWSTIMTGVWKNKHNISSNTDGAANNNWPSIYRHIYNANPQAKIYGYSTWGPIHSQFFARDMEVLTAHAEGGSDDDNLNRTLNVLENDFPDFIFLHLDEPDAAGHSHGHGQAYDDSIVRSDRRLGLLLDAVAFREQQFSENWLVLVTTDHGRNLAGKGHGGQTKKEKTIFIASNKPLHYQYKNYTAVPNNSFDGLYKEPAQTYIVPTILNFLGIMTDDHWGLDGLPLIGPIEAKSIYVNIGGKQCGLEWDINAGTPMTISRNEHVAKFDCEGNADPMFIMGNKVYTNIHGSGCGLQWDVDKGTPLTLEENEHVAKFDCAGYADLMKIIGKEISATINDQICGFQWDADAGTPVTLGSNEHVAKFDCMGSADPITIK